MIPRNLCVFFILLALVAAVKVDQLRVQSVKESLVASESEQAGHVHLVHVYQVLASVHLVKDHFVHGVADQDLGIKGNAEVENFEAFVKASKLRVDFQIRKLNESQDAFFRQEQQLGELCGDCK